ncbi:NAD(P)H-hydrate dehydratase [cf. Phormidesmis sp. LEGE 11477]|uniref:NAD(P)H-hydrate dehydratase n=1 Tax=cf. Phormidesmis sp. LEGE 11477 TaxID=1828680 RepID=UPI001882D640|nr:NAD(P)H-hydrate dehydratase [cf. Phormidesmis sp. LEGE 11477]MBE9060493.1 NAD(P)H-hydrate dehydratase [cf. Phormidesmis sp. LEGE 11477]
MTRSSIQPYLVTAEQMQQIEQQIFDSGMPVEALMEKVSAKITQRFINWLGEEQTRVGVLAGPGHNGGDALVVARELHFQGYEVQVYQPFSSLKPLTAQHARYAKSLGIAFVDSMQDLAGDVIIDGWFGFGLTRPIESDLAADIAALNQQGRPVFSIDLPSGIHTDTGEVMGTAIKANRTACLGLWKRGFMQAQALAYLGECELIDFDIPLTDVSAVLGDQPVVQRLTAERAIASLPLNRSATAHKYTAGHLLLVAGSRTYAGAALLSGLGAVASGVGMLTVAVPESIRLALLPQLPGALLIGCPETDEGAIAGFPAGFEIDKYDAIAFGPGLTPTVPALLETVLSANCPLILDADGLNLLAQDAPIKKLKSRLMPTVLTPHAGEFKRLFPNLPNDATPGAVVHQAAKESGAVILLKGPRSAIATPVQLWFNPHSTPALARGGSGDVLTGLMGGLLASTTKAASAEKPVAEKTNSSRTFTSHTLEAVLGAVWWHSQAAIYASQDRTVLGVDPLHLARNLNLGLQSALPNTIP